jgi:hypothetical protein
MDDNSSVIPGSCPHKWSMSCGEREGKHEIISGTSSTDLDDELILFGDRQVREDLRDDARHSLLLELLAQLRHTLVVVSALEVLFDFDVVADELLDARTHSSADSVAISLNQLNDSLSVEEKDVAIRALLQSRRIGVDDCRDLLRRKGRQNGRNIA